MATLSDPSQWYINDVVVNDYSKILMLEYPDVFIFDTFFFTQLGKFGYERVKKWTKKVDIFSKRLLLLPINISYHKFNHWVLVCVDNERKSITYYDSLKKKVNAMQSLSLISRYLCKEHRIKKGTELSLDGWVLPIAKNPEQTNNVDCGVFMCTFAEYLCRGADFNFDQDHIPSFRQLILYELTMKRLVKVDVPTSEIINFINNIVEKS